MGVKGVSAGPALSEEAIMVGTLRIFGIIEGGVRGLESDGEDVSSSLIATRTLMDEGWKAEAACKTRSGCTCHDSGRRLNFDRIKGSAE